MAKKFDKAGSPAELVEQLRAEAESWRDVRLRFGVEVLLDRAADEIERLQAHNDDVVYRLQHMPIAAAASAEEPWVRFDMIELTKVINVASGLENPADWVHEPCNRNHGHLAHHWSEYREGQTPLRIPHYCEGWD